MIKTASSQPIVVTPGSPKSVQQEPPKPGSDRHQNETKLHLISGKFRGPVILTSLGPLGFFRFGFYTVSLTLSSEVSLKLPPLEAGVLLAASWERDGI